MFAAIVSWMNLIGGAPALAQVLPSRHDVVDVVGAVTLTAGDGAQFPGAGVRLVLRCRSESRARVEIADRDGAYRFGGVPTVGCVVSTDLQGFGSQTKPVRVGDAADLQFHMDVRPLAAAITVRGTATPAALPATRRPRAPATACPRAGEEWTRQRLARHRRGHLVRRAHDDEPDPVCERLFGVPLTRQSPLCSKVWALEAALKNGQRRTTPVPSIQ
jgi:hypothetical protein